MQHRANPIPGTLEPVNGGYPEKLKIYRIPKSPYYYARTWMNGRMVPRSMKTDKRGEAIKRAKEFYNELLHKAVNNQPLTEGSTFKKAADGLLEEDKARVKRGERKESLVRDAEYVLPHLVEFFKADHVKTINFQRIDAYRKHMESKDKKPSSATIKNHMIWLGKVLKHAIKMCMPGPLPARWDTTSWPCAASSARSLRARTHPGHR